MKKLVKIILCLFVIFTSLNINTQNSFAIDLTPWDTTLPDQLKYSTLSQDWINAGSDEWTTSDVLNNHYVDVINPMNTMIENIGLTNDATTESYQVTYEIIPQYEITNGVRSLQQNREKATVYVRDAITDTRIGSSLYDYTFPNQDFTYLLPYYVFNDPTTYTYYTQQPDNWYVIEDFFNHATFNTYYYGIVRGTGAVVGDNALVLIASNNPLKFVEVSGAISVEAVDGLTYDYIYLTQTNEIGTSNTAPSSGDFGNANSYSWYVIDGTQEVVVHSESLYNPNKLKYTPSMQEPIETKYQGDGGKTLIDYATYEFSYLPLLSDISITTVPAIDASRITYTLTDNGTNANGMYVGKLDYTIDFPLYDTTYQVNITATNANTVFYDVLTNVGEAEPTNTTFAYQSLSSNSAPDHEGYVNLNFSYIVSQSVKAQQVVSSDFLIDDRLNNYTVSDFYVSDNGGNDWIGNITFKFVPREADYTFGFMNLTETVSINYESPSDDIVVDPSMDEYGQYTKADASNPDDFITGWHIPWKRDIYYANMRGNIQIWFEYSFFREWEEAYFSNLLSNIYITPAIHYEVIKHESYSAGSTVGNLAGRVLLEFRPSQINEEYTISLKRYSDSWLGFNDGYRYEYPTKFRIAKLNRENEENPFYWDIQDPFNPDNDYSVELGSGKAGDYIGTTINSSFGAFADVFSAFKSSLGTYTIPALFIIIILFLVPATKNKT